MFATFGAVVAAFRAEAVGSTGLVRRYANTWTSRHWARRRETWQRSQLCEMLGPWRCICFAALMSWEVNRRGPASWTCKDIAEMAFGVPLQEIVLRPPLFACAAAKLRCAIQILVRGETATFSWESGAWRQWMRRTSPCLTRTARLHKSIAVMAPCFLGHALTGIPGTDPLDFPMALLLDLASSKSARSGLVQWTTRTSPSPTVMERLCKSSVPMLGKDHAVQFYCLVCILFGRRRRGLPNLIFEAEDATLHPGPRDDFGLWHRSAGPASGVTFGDRWGLNNCFCFVGHCRLCWCRPLGFRRVVLLRIGEGQQPVLPSFPSSA